MSVSSRRAASSSRAVRVLRPGCRGCAARTARSAPRSNEIKELGLLQRGLDVMRREDAGEIEDRPRGRGDRQQVDVRRLNGAAGSMQARPLALD